MSRFRKRSEHTPQRHIEESLSAYLDNQLLPQERQAVEHHLASCRSCQWSLSTLRQTVQWTRELPTVAVPRVFTIPAPARPERSARRRWTFVPVLQAATALVALLLFFVVAGDVALTGILPSFAPQRAVLREEAPVEAVQAVPVTPEAEAASAEEADPMLEKVVTEPTLAPAPTQVAPAAEAPMAAPAAPTASPRADVEGAYAGGEAQEEQVPAEARASDESPPPGLDLTQPQALTPTLGFSLTPTRTLSAGIAKVTATGTVELWEVQVTGGPPSATVAASQQGVTAQGEPTASGVPSLIPEPGPATLATPVIEVEPLPTAVLPLPSPEPQESAAPTTVARVEEPAPLVRGEQGPESARALQVPLVAWLRVAEAVLATTLVLLGVTTIVIMLLQRKPR